MSEQTKKMVTIGLMLITTVPFIFSVNVPSSLSLDSDNFAIMALYISAITGYVGVALILWQYILGTRTVTGLFFKDLPWTIWLHTKLGIWGTLLVFLHPLLILYSYGESLVYLFNPDLSSVFETSVTYGRVAFVALLIVWFTSAIARGKIAYRPWKYVHYLSYLVLPAVFLHAPEVGSSFANSVIQFYWNSFIVLFLIFTVLRLRHVFGFGKLPFTVVAHKQLTDNIHMIRMKPVNKSIRIKLGQYIYLQKKLTGEQHPFSVTQASDKTGEITVTYKTFGKFTKGLTSLEEGERVLIDGPYGQFTHELTVDPKLPAVFIAGGIGITPFVSHVLRSGDTKRMLFFANQTKQSVVFKEILKKKLGDNFIEILSRESGKLGPRQEKGQLNTEILAKYIDKPEQYNYFICGPQGLMDAARSQLRELGVPNKNIHSEEFGF